MTQRHREKVDHWESTQEALDQLTDELQASQDRARESRREADHLRGQLGTLQEQVEALEQQVSSKGHQRKKYNVACMGFTMQEFMTKVKICFSFFLSFLENKHAISLMNGAA